MNLLFFSWRNFLKSEIKTQFLENEVLFELSVTRHEEKDSKISWISTFSFQYVAKNYIER